MSRAVKTLLEEDIRRRYSNIDSALVINVLPLTGVQANTLRADLYKKNIEFHVVKNSAARRALAGTKLERLAESLSGPCAFVTGPNVVEAAQEIIRLVKEYPTIELKQAIADGEDIITLEEMSKRRSRAELQGDVVMIFLSPARRIAGQLKVGSKIAGCVKAVADKLEKGEAITRVA
mgnify:CR=1 FL=1